MNDVKEVLAIFLNGAEGMLTPALKNVERIAAQVIWTGFCS